MRIIAGTHGGRRIGAPPGRGTRPMLDRVRESLFSILGPDLEDARVLDLYAGSGSLGLEALSRGAARARFVERGNAALKVLRANVAELRFEDRAEVLRGDALAESSWASFALETVEGGRAEVAATGCEPGADARFDPRFDVVFYDPPYPLLAAARSRGELLDAAERLVRAHLAEGGRLVFHAPKGELARRELPADLDVEERVYGSTSLWLLEGEGS